MCLVYFKPSDILCQCQRLANLPKQLYVSKRVLLKVYDGQMNEAKTKKVKFARIIIAYPVVLIVVSVVANLWLFGVNSMAVSMPSQGVITALIVTALMLLANHTWLMTSTELTRLKFNMHATPEEREASEYAKEAVSLEGSQELERRHNAHGNATENVVYFVLLATLLCSVTPVDIAAQVWFLGFAIGRLGHTFSYLTGRDSLRGIFMSISLMSLYGLASYLLISLIV
jgi:uncharacterized membrane protein YecN with MAPEG domain